MNYVTIFEVGQEISPLWKFIAAGVLFIAISIFIVRNPASKLLPKGGLQTPRARKVFGWVFLGFAVFYTVICSLLLTALHYGNERALKPGHHQTVEGIVENFIPMSYDGHNPSSESFTVNDVYFSYSDYRITPGFNQTSSHGGPIKAGLHVRIAYKHIRSGNLILRIEVPEAAR